MNVAKKLASRLQVKAIVWPALLLLGTGTFAVQSALFGSTPPITPEPIEVAEIVETVAASAVPLVDAAALHEAVEAARRQPRKLAPLPPEHIDDDVLWLARCIYSETKRPEEQELVAWVVRNRVETKYRGEATYRDVVLDPYQFSAFNPGNRKRAYYSSLGVDVQLPSWQHALNIAYHVRYAQEDLRPFSHRTRHFYSERSMPTRDPHPDWASGLDPVTPSRSIQLDAKRFRFYEGVY